MHPHISGQMQREHTLSKATVFMGPAIAMLDVKF